MTLAQGPLDDVLHRFEHAEELFENSGETHVVKATTQK